MPGAYAHFTVVNLAREPARLEAGPGLPPMAALALGRWFRYCELGAVSPDAPYLVVGNANAAAWADRMHYEHTGDMIKAGIERIIGMTGNARDKALAWLFGYAAHVITDTTIHPVVELKVGPYAQNKTAHRRCEMHQDAYIFQRLDLGGVGVGDYLQSGLEQCGPADGSLDAIIAETWQHMLSHCHPEAYANSPPEIERWYRGFERGLSLGSDGCHLMPIARHVAVGCGLTYPLVSEIDNRAYVCALETPHGLLTYDEVFAKALDHVIEGWHLIGEAVFAQSTVYNTAFGDWNLDTGRDPSGKLALWAEDTL